MSFFCYETWLAEKVLLYVANIYLWYKLRSTLFYQFATNGAAGERERLLGTPAPILQPL